MFMHLDTFRSQINNDRKAFEGISRESHMVCRPLMGFVQQSTQPSPAKPFPSLALHSNRKGG